MVVDLARLWIIDADLPAEITARCAEVLDSAERDRAATLRDPRDRQQFTIAHGALRILAAAELNTAPALLRWTAGRYGKPELAPPWSVLHTSLSHSGGLIAVAISLRRPVGVDVQHLLPGLNPARLSARFFPPAEASYVAEGSDARTRADRFAHLWTRKEAVVKAVGGRLWTNLKITVRDRDVISCAEPAGQHRVSDVAAPDGFRVAIALLGAAPFALQCWDWPNLEAVPRTAPISFPLT